MSPVEVESAIEKIRKRYDDYMVRYMQNRRARDAFEQRYFDARKARVGLDRFIIDEMKWIRRLEEEAEKKEDAITRKNSGENLQGKSGSGGGNGSDPMTTQRKEGYADRVLAELRRKIEHYSSAGLEAEEVFEVDKLYGAIEHFERNYWPKIDRIYRKVYPSRYSGPRIILENRLFELAEPSVGRFPQRLQNLVSLLDRFPRNYREIEWESKQCILGASFFLHSIEEELGKLRNEGMLPNADLETVEKSCEFVHTVIEDFRLTDLKEQEGK